MKLLAVVLTIGEPLFPLCKKRLEEQTVKFDEIFVIENVYPMRTAYNVALDYATDNNAEYLFLLDGDIISHTNYAKNVINTMNANPNCFLVTNYSRDVFMTPCPGGARLFKMKVVRKYRYDGSFLGDSTFANKIASETKLQRILNTELLSDHHPIWTPEELWMRLRFSLPKYKNKLNILRKFNASFHLYRSKYRDNLVVKIGFDFFRIMIEDLDSWILGDKNYPKLKRKWDEFSKQYNLTGYEYFTPYPEYEKIAEELFRRKNV